MIKVPDNMNSSSVGLHTLLTSAVKGVTSPGFWGGRDGTGSCTDGSPEKLLFH